jgi:glycosidase
MPWRAPSAQYEAINVAVQDPDPDSLLNHYRALIDLRHEHAALSGGNITLLETGNPGVYAALRASADENILVVINLKDEPISDYQLRLSESVLPDGTFTPQSLFGTIEALPLVVSGGKFSEYQPVPELSPYQPYLLLLN